MSVEGSSQGCAVVVEWVDATLFALQPPTTAKEAVVDYSSCFHRRYPSLDTDERSTLKEQQHAVPMYLFAMPAAIVSTQPALVWPTNDTFLMRQR